jgi:hypothetical protein
VRQESLMELVGGSLAWLCWARHREIKAAPHMPSLLTRLQYDWVQPQAMFDENLVEVWHSGDVSCRPATGVLRMLPILPHARTFCAINVANGHVSPQGDER